MTKIQKVEKDEPKCIISQNTFELEENGKTNMKLLNGYWIWWCYTHNQPHYQCRIDKLESSSPTSKTTMEAVKAQVELEYEKRLDRINGEDLKYWKSSKGTDSREHAAIEIGEFKDSVLKLLDPANPARREKV